MRTTLYIVAVAVTGLLSLPAFAQPPEGPRDGDRPPADPAMKQKLLDAFDNNHDGTIDRAEAREIGRALHENFGIGPPRGDRRGGPEGRGPDGPPPRDREARGPDGPPPGPPRDRDDRRHEGRRGPRGERGPEGRGPDGRGPDEGRPGGPPPRGPDDDRPPGPPNPERLFNRFDENKDSSLSKDEFMKLSDFMREHRPLAMRERMREDRDPDRPPRAEGRRGRRPGPPGPPPGPDGPPGPPPGASAVDPSPVEGTAAEQTPVEETTDEV